jgi:membrane fusion protein, multidrug efflux system
MVNPDNTVSMRVIKVGVTEGDNTSIEQGINPGDVVVTDGADKLRDGAKVDVASKDAKPGTGTNDAHPHNGGHGKNGAASTSAAAASAASAPDASTPANDANADSSGAHHHHKDGATTGKDSRQGGA